MLLCGAPPFRGEWQQHRSAIMFSSCCEHAVSSPLSPFRRRLQSVFTSCYPPTVHRPTQRNDSFLSIFSQFFMMLCVAFFSPFSSLSLSLSRRFTFPTPTRLCSSAIRSFLSRRYLSHYPQHTSVAVSTHHCYKRSIAALQKCTDRFPLSIIFRPRHSLSFFHSFFFLFFRCEGCVTAFVSGVR